MKLTGPACTEALNGVEEARSRERVEGNAGGVRVELGVRASGRNQPPAVFEGEMEARCPVVGAISIFFARYFFKGLSAMVNIARYSIGRAIVMTIEKPN